MVPPIPDTPDDDTEFDLDVKLQAVARYVSVERGRSPPRRAPSLDAHAIHVQPA
jgi:hypothetical protein